MGVELKHSEDFHERYNVVTDALNRAAIGSIAMAMGYLTDKYFINNIKHIWRSFKQALLITH